MSFFKVGKYEVRAWAFGSSGPNGRRMNGHWSVTDPSNPDEPVADGACSTEREGDGAAINDALTAGREAAEALIAKDGA
jgi:hypothetical protein